MRRSNPAEERRARIMRAKDAFLRAGAALTTWPLERDALALALIEGGIGLMLVAQADDGYRALDKVLAVLEERSAAKGEGST